ncbi:MAG TPA: hypothetical protein VF781_07685 [Solirubrobacteraceae bacterium]
MLILPVLLALLALAPPTGAAVRRTPTQAPTNSVVDGPSADIQGLTGLFVGRDGTGGLVYLKNVAGVPHVFVSSLTGGSFQAPRQVDAGLGGASSQPVITGASGGELLVAFINGGELYTALTPNGLAGWQPPRAMYGGASNPAVSMSNFGKAYLAFTASGSGGSDVRTAFLKAGQWAPVSAPLDVQSGDGAGAGSGRPRVVACGDGTGIVVWGEGGHVYLRRVLGSSPSIATYQADPASVQGAPEVSADEPMIGSGGDSSYASVTFRETVQSGATQQTRVLFNHLIAGRFTGAQPVDGLGGPGPQSADQPFTATTEFGAGFVTAEQTPSHNLYALRLNQNAWPAGVQQINSLPELSSPDAVTSAAGTVSTLVAWQQDSGTATEIRLRYASDGINLSPDLVLSSPDLGPTNADLGLGAGGDLGGDAAVAWVQGSGDQTRIVVAQLYQPAGGFSPAFTFGYSARVNPVLSWSAASEQWGAPNYQVKVDGTLVAQTTSTSVTVPIALTQGRHAWQVTAVNPAGVPTVARGSTVLVDSLPPIVSLRVTGRLHVGQWLHAYVRALDTRPGLPVGQVSGVNTVQVKWGDGSEPFMGSNSAHVYRRRGRFVLTVIVTDRAGNRTVITRRIHIVPVAKPKPRGRAGRPAPPKHTVRHASAR